jgi:type IV pilus assembly protein PilC
MLMGIMVKPGGSIFSAMKRSASASGSALFEQGAARAVLAVQGGEGLGAAVMRTHAFPEPIDRAFQVGEASGRLDEEMERQAGRYNEQFQTRLEILSMWLPKIIYLAIAIALGFRIVAFYASYFGEMNSLLP